MKFNYLLFSILSILAFSFTAQKAAEIPIGEYYSPSGALGINYFILKNDTAYPLSIKLNGLELAKLKVGGTQKLNPVVIKKLQVKTEKDKDYTTLPAGKIREIAKLIKTSRKNVEVPIIHGVLWGERIGQYETISRR